MQSMFLTRRPLVLASNSPRRKDFLQMLGLDFSVCAAARPEPEREEGEEPGFFCVRVARQKAWEVFEKLSLEAGEARQNEQARQAGQAQISQPVILAADTIVVLDDAILHKPPTKEAALQMLTALGGRKHAVYTGCCLLLPKFEAQASFCAPKGTECVMEETFFACSYVRMGRYPQEVLRAYAQSGEPMDKAGAYAIQGQGAFLIDTVQGSWTNIVGLPLELLVPLLLKYQVIESAALKQSGSA